MLLFQEDYESLTLTLAFSLTLRRIAGCVPGLTIQNEKDLFFRNKLTQEYKETHFLSKETYFLS